MSGSGAIKIDLQGVDNLLSKLENLDQAGKMAAMKIITYGTLQIHKIAIDSLDAEGKSGRIYREGSTREHQASAPGEAPSSDTGNLRSSLYFDIDTNELEGHVGARAQYALDLELGTDKMEARPFLVPAFYQALPDINENIQEAWHDAMNQS